ncbi:putative disease resistance protein RGA4, partial [Bienertia sinuspersici]
SKIRYLRISDLHGNKLENLPCKIGELLHLRYLELSEKNLDILLNSITQLYTLQTHSDISACDKLKSMPRRVNSMTTLNKLPLGFMEIRMKRGWMYDVVEVKEGGYLINKPHLSGVSIHWSDDISEVDRNAEALLHGLVEDMKD